MALIPALVVFAPGTKIKSAEANSNFDAIKTAFNTSAVLTDVARTINVAHTFNNDILFTDASFDIGKTGATRPRDGFFSRNVTAGTAFLGALTGNVTGNLTGTVLTASQPNITSLGALNGLTVNGVTILLGDVNNFQVKGTGGSSYIQLYGVAASGHFNWQIGKSVTAANALEFLPSAAADGITFPAAAATLTRLGVLTTTTVVANVSGNLTGTVLTAAQANITSLGALTGLVVNGNANFGSAALNHTWNASYRTIELGPNAALFYRPASDEVYIYSNAYNDGVADKYAANGSAVILGMTGGAANWLTGPAGLAGNPITLTTRMTLSNVGVLSVPGGFTGNLTGTVLTAAQGNITSLGTLSFLTVNAGGGETIRMLGNDVIGGYMSIRSLTLARGYLGNGSSIFAGGAVSDFGLASEGGSLRFATTSGTIRMTISDSTGVVSAGAGFSGPLTGAVTGNVTGNVSGNLTGTVLTAAQGNITSLGTLTSLTVSGALSAGATTVTSLIGLVVTTLGAPSANTATLATIGGAGSPVATQAQAKWLPITGSDALVYYVPAWR